ncbi:MAG: patatin-like phospholipase family protein [Tepidisphaeraceae bacterium]|jgi:hypothetical protein
MILAGCASRIVRHPVPLDLASEVHPIGMSAAIRAWGDGSSSDFQSEVTESLRQVRAAYGDQQARDILVLSGGGANGAFGAGLLCGWTASGKRPTFRVVTGVSAGAIIATFAYLGSSYDAQLKELATKVSMQDVFVPKALAAALGSDSLSSTAPLVRLVERFYDQRVLDAVAAEHSKGRRLYVGTTNLDAQRSVVWDMGAIASHHSPQALSLFRQVILASSAIPIYFPPIYIDVEARGRKYDEMHVDGSIIQQFVLYGYAVSPQSPGGATRPSAGPVPKVYAIRNGKIAPEPQAVTPGLFPIDNRAITTLTKSQAIGDIYQAYAMTRVQGLDFNLAFIPDDFNMQGLQAIEEFDTRSMIALFNCGYSLGRSDYPWRKTPP